VCASVTLLYNMESERLYHMHCINKDVRFVQCENLIKARGVRDYCHSNYASGCECALLIIQLMPSAQKREETRCWEKAAR